MKLRKPVLSFLILSILFTACRKGSIWGIKGEGDTVTESRVLTNFNAIDLSTDANVIFLQDSVYRVELNAQQNILAVMDVQVEGNILHIDMKRNLWKHKQITVTVHCPGLNKMILDGSGDMTVQSALQGANLDLLINGSGNISVASLSVQSLSAHVGGSGNITVNSGTCQNETLNISGSGNIRTEFMSTDNGDARISGSGTVILNAGQTLNVNISGSGNVKYRGHPAVHSQISGSGKLIQLD